MGSFYQTSDTDIIDYEMYKYHDLELRGPKTDNTNYISYIGAAQTFGRYCKAPFPNIIGNKLNIGTLNFGVGARGPEYFLGQKTVLDAVNESKLVVIQVMSSRSISNSIFKSADGGRRGIRLKDQKEMVLEDVFKELLTGKDIRGLNQKFMENLVKETRQNYVNAMINLLEAIQPPKILLWFSVRTPQYQEVYPNHLREAFSLIFNRKDKFRKRFHRFFGAFPHLVNNEMIDAIKQHSDYHVECITNTGLPQVLINSQGKEVGQNNYYPSPQMHVRAAELLYPVCKSVLSS